MHAASACIGPSPLRDAVLVGEDAAPVADEAELHEAGERDVLASGSRD